MENPRKDNETKRLAKKARAFYYSKIMHIDSKQQKKY